MIESQQFNEQSGKDQVRMLLLKVDQTIKAGNLDEALNIIHAVYQYDPKNLYARAYEERVRVMIAGRDKTASDTTAQKEKLDQSTRVDMNRKLVDFQQRWEQEAAKRAKADQDVSVLEQRARQAALEEQKVEDESEYAAMKNDNRDQFIQWERKMKEEVQAAIEEKRILLDKELTERLESIAAAAAMSEATVTAKEKSMEKLKEQMEIDYAAKLLLSKDQMEQDAAIKLETARAKLHEEMLAKVHSETALVKEELHRRYEAEHKNWMEAEQEKMHERMLSAYRTNLMVLDTAIEGDHREAFLLSLRMIFNVSDAEHLEILRSVQLNSYIETLRASWKDGKVSAEEKNLLHRLCELYGISQEEHEQLTKQVKLELGLPEDAEVILLVDDSKDILIFADRVLRSSYAKVSSAESAKEAAELIAAEMPTLIICDVMMPEVGGFAFYDMIQKGELGEEVKDVPFIFMSACSDDYMKKIAEGLGVNRYLTKPLMKESLLKTVKEALATN